MAGSECRTMTLTYEEQDYVIVATDENGKQYFIPKDESNSDYQKYLNPEAGHEPYLGKLAIPYLTPSGVIDIRFRSLNNDSGPKYLSRPGASTHIYNVQALNDDTDFLVICEGELDTIIATQVGFSAVGLPGANNWKPFYSRVLADWEKIMLFCDGDNAGKEMAKTITRELDNVFPVFMPDNCDVNDVFLAEGAEGLRKRVGV